MANDKEDLNKKYPLSGLYGAPSGCHSTEPDDYIPPPNSADDYGSRNSLQTRGATKIGDELVEIECTIEHTTAKAYLIEPTCVGEGQHWCPKSQVHKSEDVGGGKWVFHVTEWWAKKAGLV